MYISCLRSARLVRFGALSLVLFLFLNTIIGQAVWENVEPRSLPTDADRRIHPKVARLVEVSPDSLRSVLWSAPHERQMSAEQSPLLLSVPTPDGALATFRIVAYDICEAADLRVFPDIRTWYGINTDGSGQSIFLDYTAVGFHAAVRFGDAAPYFIDPLFYGRQQWYQAYFVADAGQDAEAFDCQTVAENLLPDEDPSRQGEGRSISAGDCDLRSYRTAIAATGEYSNFFGATSAAQANLVQSAVVTTVNRVNQVFTRELALRLVLVANNQSVYYYNPNTDPYAGTNPGTLLTQNTPNLNSVLGSNAYDLGHIFSAGFNSGVAYLRSSCGGSKGGGVTGRSTPIGDPFDIDYVAHEMGHQLGGNHTQNNGCNYSSSAGMEPGSGNSIMGYAGICSPNLQSNSDAYFHGRNIAEITNHVELGGGNSCATIINTALNNPNVTPQTDESIPFSTPFRLVAEVSGNGTLAYGWEQYDAAQATMPPQSTSMSGPLFRGFFPVAAPDRYFPRLADLVAGNNSTWEVLPSVGRQMNFRMTVRNYNATYGCAGEDDVRLTVDGGKGPFVVTDPSQGNQLSAGQVAQVQWDVANTNQAPINSQLMEILLSTDGGQSFTLLASNEANDGLATVSLPNQTSNNAYMMVRSQDNVFFNVSSQSFRIVSSAGAPSVGISNLGPSSLSDCFSSETTASFAFLTSSAGGATAPITFSVSGLPAPATASFFPNPVQPGGTTSLLLDNLDQLPSGSYTLSIQGNSANGNVGSSVQLEKTGGSGGAGPALLSPAFEQTGLDLRPTLSVANNGSGSYEFQLSTDSGFSNLLLSTTENTNTYTIGQYLQDNTTYYWRSRTASPTCGATEWTTGIFTTGDCYIYESTAAPITISAGQPPIQVEMPIEVPDMGTVLDVDIYQLDISHTYLEDLEIRLIAPDNTSRRLINRRCGSQDDLLISLDDEASSAYFCPPVEPNAFVAPPDASLSAFDGRSINGIWRLRVNDLANLDGGSLNSFSLKLCVNDFAVLPVAWLSFEVRPQQEALLLHWETAEEQNNAGFYVERSLGLSNARSWETIGFVEALGNDSGGRYTFADEGVEKGREYFYRLRQVDTDGTIDYSPIRSGRLDGAATTLLDVFPNPSKDFFSYRWLTEQDTELAFDLLDMRGVRLQQGRLLPSGGSLDLSLLPRGVYVLRLENGRAYRLLKQ